MITQLLAANFILAADSYKVSHAEALPKDVEYMCGLVVPRKASTYTDEIVAAGQTVTAHLIASIRITNEDIIEAIIEAHEQGYELNWAPWRVIVDEYDGRLPLAIYGVEEGRVIKPQTPILAIVNTDHRFAWLESYVETVVQRIIWKMSTVATVSRYCYNIIGEVMSEDGSDMTMLEYKLHNFGDRGADGYDAAVMAAIAHAMLFSGSDCLSANRYIKKLYQTDKAYLSSIGATEHSVMCANSDAANKDDFGAAVMAVGLLDSAVDRAKRGIGIPLQAVVIDTYDSKRFAREYLGTRLKDRIVNSGGKLIGRPDSGDPVVEPIEIVKIFDECFGTFLNSKDYKVLPPYIGVIQGDGINVHSISDIMNNLNNNNYAMDNLAFGMGGGLTHEAGRDEFSFSMKATAMQRTGKEWENLLKEPITDRSKKSLTGLVRCYEGEEGLEVRAVATIEEFGETGPGWKLWAFNGHVTNFQDFDSVREFARVSNGWPR